MPKKKRRPPRKRAINQQQTVEQLRRFQRLLNKWLDEQEALVGRQVLTQQKIKQYRDKVDYYQRRLENEALTSDRPLRSINLGDPDDTHPTAR
jgi:hypothetical protein